jgi:hypothetical protein
MKFHLPERDRRQRQDPGALRQRQMSVEHMEGGRQAKGPRSMLRDQDKQGGLQEQERSQFRREPELLRRTGGALRIHQGRGPGRRRSHSLQDRQPSQEAGRDIQEHDRERPEVDDPKRPETNKPWRIGG